MVHVYKIPGILVSGLQRRHSAQARLSVNSEIKRGIDSQRYAMRIYSVEGPCRFRLILAQLEVYT